MSDIFIWVNWVSWRTYLHQIQSSYSQTCMSHLPDSFFLFAFSYEWFIPIKWMKSGVEQPQYWLLQKTGMTMLRFSWIGFWINDKMSLIST